MVIVACIAGGVLLLHLLQWVWRPSSRRGHNDVTATNVGVIGTTYAVLIAFMLSNVWTSFRAAESNAEQESNSLVNVFRIAKTLPQPERGHIQQLARDYATEVVDREWRAMGTGAEIGVGLPRPLWDAVSQIQPQSAGEQIGVDQAFRGTAQPDRASPYPRAAKPQPPATASLGGINRGSHRNRGSHLPVWRREPQTPRGPDIAALLPADPGSGCHRRH
ncbi:MAG TPA: hypothetical protein VKB77_05095 [Terriglobales bacterium]|nr:hypothetical protein [Terriglobales bacterium]